MTLKEFTQQDPLTSDQQTMVASIDSFMDSNASVFLMMGHAGTGKTYLLKRLADWLQHKKRHALLMAPTGRAAKIISERTGHPAGTIHRSLYQMDTLKEFKHRNENGTETYKYYYDIRTNLDPAQTVYIVDEASMLSDAYNEHEFFRWGSGHLLQDLVRYVDLHHSTRKPRLIFCGDPCQLPPVNDKISRAFEKKWLSETYGIEVHEYTMREVLRQQGGILENAAWLRDRIEANVFSSFHMQPGEDVQELQSYQLVDCWSRYHQKQKQQSSIIIARTNQQVCEMNRQIRERLYGQKAMPPQAGDQLMIVRNSYSQDVTLFNGEFVQVIHTEPEVTKRTITLKRLVPNLDNKTTLQEIKVELAFRKIEIVTIGENLIPIRFKVLINENLLDSPAPVSDSDECRALYIDFKIRHSQLSEGTAEFREALRADPYFNCLQAKYGYAVTGHKSQGGEWPVVFADMQPGGKPQNADYYRWAYTVITRAKQNLYFLHAPQFHSATARTITQLEETERERIAAAVLPPLDPDVQLPANLLQTDEGLNDLLCRISVYVKPLRWLVAEAVSRPYQLHITAQQEADDGKFARLIIFYKSNRTITKIQSKDGADTEILTLLREGFSGKRLIAVESENAALGIHQDSAPDFIKTIQQTISPIHASISHFKEISQYHTEIQFRRGNAEAVVNYYFKKTGLLNKVISDASRSNCTALIEELLKVSSPAKLE